MKNAKLFFENGSIGQCALCQKDYGAVKACFIDYKGEEILNPDCGAVVPVDVSFVKYMAINRHSEYWCSPFFSSYPSECPEQVQLLLYQKPDGKYGVVLPVVSQDYKCVIRGSENGFEAYLFSWYKKSDIKALAFVSAEGDDPFALTENCVKTALKILNNGCSTRDERRYPEIFEYLGWCSWDALQIRVSEDGLIEKCEEFKSKNIPVKWVIIDDMWAEIAPFNTGKYNSRQEMFALMHSSPMYDYEASYTRFPNGLAHTIEKIHENGMKVGMWHPSTGYWFGLDPKGEAYKKLRYYTTVTEDGRIISDWHTDNAFGFFNTIHSFLRRCGADFLKVDNQSMTRRFYRGMESVGKTTSEWHRGLEASVGLNFDSTMINCMGMASEDMFNRTFSPISRCSDDFQPEDRPWFTHHILQCTFNSLLQGQFYYNDFDMWWTDDSQAEKNSLLRAVSGGPIYVSDEIGRSRAEILKPLAFADGKILRCDRSGMPTADCLLDNPEYSGKPLKIQNITGDCGAVACFNVTKEQNEVSGTVSPSDVPGLSGEKFVIYEHFSGEFSIVDYDGKVDFSIKNTDDYRLFIIVPYKNGFAPLGLIDKFISPASITAKIGENTELYEGGRYGYIKDGKLYIENR